jgi:hypothetical protein
VTTIEKHLQILGPLKHDHPLPQFLELTRGSIGVVEKTKIFFVSDGKAGWDFEAATFAIDAEQQQNAYATIDSLLRKRLGKPRWSMKESEGGPSAGWSLGREQSLLLAGSDPRAVSITISEPQGP